MKGSAKKIPFRFWLTPIDSSLFDNIAGLKFNMARSKAANARYFHTPAFLSSHHAVALGSLSGIWSGCIYSVTDVLDGILALMMPSSSVDVSPSVGNMVSSSILTYRSD